MARAKSGKWMGIVLILVVCVCGGFEIRAEQADPLAALVPVLAQTQDPQTQIDILKGMREGLKAQRSVKMPAGWEALAARLGKSNNAEVRSLVQSLSLTFGSQTALKNLRKDLLDTKADPEKRNGALEALLGARDPLLAESLRKLIAEPLMRRPALRGLAAYDDAAAPGVILAAFHSMSADEKRDALNTLGARVSYARALLDALEKGTVARGDLSADIVRQVRNLKNDELIARLDKVWGKSRASSEDKLKDMARYKALVLDTSLTAADPAKGRGIFSHTCQQCHTLYGVGGKVGPDLTGSNRGDIDYLLENIVDPNAIIPNDYKTWTCETKDDRVMSGILRVQDDKSVTLVLVDQVVTVPRSEIRSLEESQYSMMPEGLLTALNDGEVRDLISYLRGKKQVEPAQP